MPNKISVKKYKKKYIVTIICPHCEKTRVEEWKLRPDMKTPRILCKSCVNIKPDHEEI